MNQTPQQDALPVHNYVLAFIDLLGQQRALKGCGLIPPFKDNQAREQFIQTVRDTVLAIEDLQLSCQTMYDQYQSKEYSLKHLVPPSKHEKYDQIKITKIKTQRWSDGFVAYYSAGDPEILAPMNSLFGLIATCGSMMFMSLAKKRPIRGALEIAWGVELHNNELYGCVVSRAYNLESKVAQYPRIVVGPILHQYIFAHINNANSDEIATFNRVIALKCREMIATDDDGYPILDYLGEGFRKYVIQDHYDHMAKLAWNYIVEQSEQFRREGETTLAIRYAKLREYFRSRIKDIPADLEDA